MLSLWFFKLKVQCTSTILVENIIEPEAQCSFLIIEPEAQCSFLIIELEAQSTFTYLKEIVNLRVQIRNFSQHTILPLIIFQVNHADYQLIFFEYYLSTNFI